MMKRIICVLMALCLSLNVFSITWDGVKAKANDVLDDFTHSSLINMIGDGTTDVTPQLKQRIIELAQKDPGKLRNQLREQNNAGRTPLFYAVEMMDEQLLDMMLVGLSIYAKDVINTPDYDGISVLAKTLIINDLRRLIIAKKLIDKGADCNYTFNSGNLINASILILAIETQDKELIRLILSKTNNVNEYVTYLEGNNLRKITPLMHLFEFTKDLTEYDDIVKILLEKGADPKKKSNYWDSNYEGTPLHCIAQKNNKTLYNLLKQYGGDSKLPDSEGHTPFEILAGFCENDADRLFLAYEEKEDANTIIDSIIKNDINQKSTGDKKTALQIALCHDDSASAVKLLNKGADIYSEDSEHKTALDYAVSQKADTFIEACIEKKKSAKKSIYSIIDYSLNKGDLEYVEKFFAIDSAKYGSTHNYFTYTVATPYGDFDTRKALLEFFLKKGSSVNDSVVAGDDKGNTALIYAAKQGNAELVKYLIEKGADINVCNSGKYDGRSAIFYALETKDKQTVNELLSHKEIKKSFTKQLNNKADKNATFLMFFARYAGWEQMKKYLPEILKMDKSALTRKDSEQLTPFLYAAAYNEDPDVMKVLRMYGADVNAKAGPSNAADLAAKKNDNAFVIVERLNSYGVYSN